MPEKDWREEQAEREALVAAAIEKCEIRHKAQRGIPMNAREWNGLREADPDLYEKSVRGYIALARAVIDEHEGASLRAFDMGTDKAWREWGVPDKDIPALRERMLWAKHVLLKDFADAWLRWRALDPNTVAASVEWERICKMLGYKVTGTMKGADGTVRLMARHVPAYVHDKILKLEERRKMTSGDCLESTQ